MWNKCPICGDEELTVIGELDTHTLKECSKCGFRWFDLNDE